MKKFNKILLIGYTKNDLREELWARLEGLALECVLVPKDAENIPSELKEADALLVKLGATVDGSLMDAGSGLRFVGMYGTGYGRIDTDYARSKNITVCNIADYATQGVAEFSFAAILSRIRELERAHNQALAGNYSEESFEGIELGGKIFGILGLGDIGTRIAKIAADGFGAKVLYWSRTRKTELETPRVEFCELEELLSQSDVLSVNLALVGETEGFLDRDRLNKLKKGALLVNLSPMELIDLPAVEERLKAGDISLILDHSDEMDSDDAKRLAGYANCDVYPPVAYTTREATLLKQKILVDNIANFLSGHPTNVVN